MWGQWLQKLVGLWLSSYWSSQCSILCNNSVPYVQKLKSWRIYKNSERRNGFKKKPNFLNIASLFSVYFFEFYIRYVTYLFIISFVTFWLIHKYWGHWSESPILNLGFDQCLESHLRRVAERIPESVRQARRPGRPVFPYGVEKYVRVLL